MVKMAFSAAYCKQQIYSMQDHKLYQATVAFAKLRPAKFQQK